MRLLVCLLALTVVSAAEDDTSVADREKTGYDLSPPNDKNDAKVNPVLPCYLLGEADQIAAQTHTSAWLKPRNISKRCDHKRKVRSPSPLSDLAHRAETPFEEPGFAPRPAPPETENSGAQYLPARAPPPATNI